MAKKLIEMVCAGNRGRSPVAELLANNRIRDIGASDDYGAISSGTNVDYTKRVMSGEETPSQEMVTAIIDMGRGREIYTPSQLQEIDEAFRNGREDVLVQYFKQASQRLMDDENSHRRKIIAEFGVEGEVKQTNDQTIARSDTVIVLAMDRKNLQNISSIYGERGYSPKIDTLSSYATKVAGSQVLNAFARGEDVYRETVEQLVKEVPMAVDRAIESF